MIHTHTYRERERGYMSGDIYAPSSFEFEGRRSFDKNKTQNIIVELDRFSNRLAKK